MRTPTFSVEVITLPVRDVERALRCYVDQAGFTLDVDHAPNNALRVVQLTPPAGGSHPGSTPRAATHGEDYGLELLAETFVAPSVDLA